MHHQFGTISVCVVNKEGCNIVFNNAFNTFYLLLYGVGHIVNE